MPSVTTPAPSAGRVLAGVFGAKRSVGCVPQFILGADGQPIRLEIPQDLRNRPVPAFASLELEQSAYTGVADPESGTSAAAVLALLCRRLSANAQERDDALADQACLLWTALEGLPARIDLAFERIEGTYATPRDEPQPSPVHSLRRLNREFAVQQLKAATLVREPDSYAYLLRPAQRLFRHSEGLKG